MLRFALLMLAGPTDVWLRKQGRKFPIGKDRKSLAERGGARSAASQVRGVAVAHSAAGVPQGFHFDFHQELKCMQLVCASVGLAEERSTSRIGSSIL